MNLKRKPIRLVSGGLNAMMKFTGATAFGLGLFAFGLPMSGGWLAAAAPRLNRRCLRDDLGP